MLFRFAALEVSVPTDPESAVRNKTIATAATPAEKAAFEQFCLSKDMRPAQMLRLMLSRVCPEAIAPGDQPVRALKDAPLYLRLGSEDILAIRALCQSESITPQDWVRKVVRTALHRTPQFKREEENALLESNRELAHIGRNINQIAHQLNISLNATDQVNADNLRALAKSIDVHKDRVAALVNASWGRFGGEGKP
jgi:hypothetical protein